MVIIAKHDWLADFGAVREKRLPFLGDVLCRS